jgi:phosphoribosyl-ATP pyrophosphohydrolase/phosphoribosyl-AMP cyclohydrolase
LAPIKFSGLIPAIIQHATDKEVLMLGFMNQESFDLTLQSKRVTFFSRSRQRLWMKGESSKNFLNLVSYAIDCDNDCLLIQALPDGPTCHRGTRTCFNENETFLDALVKLIKERKGLSEGSSYTARLFNSGIPRIAQKVGEEAVEVVIEAVRGNSAKLKEEAADLLFHLLVLFEASDISIGDVFSILESRNATKS